MSKHILVLDGETKASLAIVRSLGSLGHHCTVSSSKSEALAAKSKYCKSTVLAPDPILNFDLYCTWLVETIEKMSPDFVLFSSDASLRACCFSRQSIQIHTTLILPTTQAIELIEDKFSCMNHAKGHGILTPKTRILHDTNNPHSIVDLQSQPDNEAEKFIDAPFPWIAKPRKSAQITSEGGITKPPIFKLETLKDFKQFLFSTEASSFEYIIQECIQGEGVGVFHYIYEGESRAHFSHQRILEKPPEGGVSVVCSFQEVPQEILDRSESILTDLTWEGVAMLEFKRTKEGKYFLIEINPRFWGSLQLAIDSGVNFPVILLEAELSDGTKPSSPVPKATSLRWEFGLLDHLLILLKRRDFPSIYAIFKNNKGLFFRPNVRNELLRYDDLSPFFCATKLWIKGICPL